MSKKHLQPPFKKYVKTENGYIIENKPFRYIEPIDDNPLKGWEICWDATITDRDGNVIGLATMCDLIVATADTKGELE